MKSSRPQINKIVSQIDKIKSHYQVLFVYYLISSKLKEQVSKSGAPSQKEFTRTYTLVKL